MTTLPLPDEDRWLVPNRFVCDTSGVGGVVGLPIAFVDGAVQDGLR